MASVMLPAASIVAARRARRLSARRVGGQQLQRGVAQRPPAGAGRRPARTRPASCRPPCRSRSRSSEVRGHARAQRLARLVDRGRDRPASMHQRQVRLARAGCSSSALKAGVGRLVLQRPAERLGVALLADLVRAAGGAGQDQVAGQGLAGLPAVEQVRVGGQQHVAVLGRRVGGEVHRRREAAQRRDHRLRARRPRASPCASWSHDHSHRPARAVALEASAGRPRPAGRSRSGSAAAACPAGRASARWPAAGSSSSAWRSSS